jgi:hypothetical protein
VTGITLAGADAGNYVLANTGATTQADIKALPVDLTYVAYHAPIANPSGVGNTTYGNNLGSSGQGELASAPAPGVAATAPAQPRGNQGSAPRAPSVRPLNSWVDVVDNGVLIAP